MIHGDDFNISFTNGLSRCDAFNKFAQSLNLYLRDTKGDIAYTYTVVKLNKQHRLLITFLSVLA